MTHALVHIIMRSPLLMAIFGFVVMAGSGFLGYKMWQQVQQYPAQPVHMNLADALSKPVGSDIWVTIDDATWDCGSLRYYQIDNTTIHTTALFDDVSGAMKGISTIGNQVSCEQLRLQAVRGLATVRNSPAAGRYLSICAWCGGDNARLGLYILGGFFLMGLLIEIPAFRQMRRGVLIA